jgi:hypothetical protein
MPDLLKSPLLLASFALLSVLVTAAAAGLALHRPSVSQLTLETRSRLVADYSSDPLAKRLQPLDPDVIRAATQDEADLSEDLPAPQPVVPLPTATPAGIVPGASPVRDATTVPTARPPAGSITTPTPRPADTSTPGAATSTLGPSPTRTPVTPTSTYTPRPTFTPTPQPTATPPPKATPPPTKAPPPTTVPPTATNAPQPTATPKPGATPDLCKILPVPPPLCE